MKSKIDKKRFKDEGGRWLTQSLFLEYQYNTEFAIYTLDEEDKEYKGKIYPSLKKLFIANEDVVEYQFAKTHLGSWEQWQRICNNKWCLKHIEEWREELEVAIASSGVQSILDLAQDGNFQAAKYAANREWTAKKRGRPSKAEVERRDKIDEKIKSEFEDDAARVEKIVPLR